MGVQEILPPLISATKLRNLIKLPNSFVNNYRVLEANVGQNFRVHYNQGHIEKAVYIDTLHCTIPTKLNPRNIPEPRCFADYVGSLGISNKHHLIIYDRSPFGFFASSRMWWIFRLFGHENVSILSGGMRSWNSNNYELSTEEPSFQKEVYQLLERKELIRDHAQIKQNLETKRELVVDARGSEEFERMNEATGRPNHIPLARNVPYAELFDEQTATIKEKEQLAELFKKNGVDFRQLMVASCQTGMTACSLAFAAYLLGAKQVPIYYGSWTEYSQKEVE